MCVNIFRQPERLKATPNGVVGGLKTHPTAFLYFFRLPETKFNERSEVKRKLEALS
ncbi:MAG: hypothetical protein IKZ88_06070 [Neisseriaceae bacterium]|nr:hypothetical protein [Neisseriaceae bacterium]